jgi:CHASE2 domain-containing sensor protein
VVIGVQQLGALEEAELNFFDRLVRLQSDEGPAPRLLVVTVTEEDIQKLGKWPTDDCTLDKVFDTLEQHQPRVIGLDIYRDLPVEPGNIELATRMEVNDNIIAVCKVGDAGDPGVPPPPKVPESRVGFSDVVVDPSGIVRRSLLVQTPDKTSKCAADQSFSLQLALHYLEKQGIQQQLTAQNHLQIGSTIFKPIEEYTAGYQNIDARGYQVLLNYRSPSNIARKSR